MNKLRERLTYRLCVQLIGLLVALGVGIAWIQAESNPENPDIPYEPIVFVVGIVGGLATLIIPVFFPKLLSDQPIFLPRGQERAISEDTRRKNRDAMLKGVKEIWIDGFLYNALNQMESLKLSLEFAEPEKILQRPGLSHYKLPTTAEIQRVYTELNRRVVILGEPGAGKTILMLQLAKILIEEAQNDASRPIPVVFALSSWAAEKLPFEDWLCAELRDRYGLSSKVADDLVQGEQLLYLLDGLDEVAESERDACLQAIKLFMEQERTKVDYVLCCRRKEFEQLPTRLTIPGEIIIQPLKPVQIQDYLRGAEFAGLRGLMIENAILREQFAPIPFMLNTMAVVTRGQSETQLRLAIHNLHDADTLRDYFLEAYLTQRLKDHKDDRYPDLKRTRQWLSWLAGQLVRHDQTDFYIENLQPDWLDSDAQRQRYHWLVRVLVGVVFGVVFGVLGGVVFGVVFGVLGGVVFGVVFGVLGGISAKSNVIRMADQLNWALSRENVVFGVLGGVVFGVLVGVVGGVVFGVLGGVLVGVVGGVVVGFSTRQTVLLRVQPNHGLRRSFRNFGVVWLVTVGLVGMLGGVLGGVLVGVLFGVLVGVLFGVLGGVLVGVVFGVLFGGGDAVLQHMALRWLLARDGHIPRWCYDNFLDYAAELVILRKVGGGYRFVHDYLRQYLARVEQG